MNSSTEFLSNSSFDLELDSSFVFDCLSIEQTCLFADVLNNHNFSWKPSIPFPSSSSGDSSHSLVALSPSLPTSASPPAIEMSGRKQRRWKVRALHRLVWIVVCYRQWHCCTLQCLVWTVVQYRHCTLQCLVWTCPVRPCAVAPNLCKSVSEVHCPPDPAVSSEPLAVNLGKAKSLCLEDKQLNFT